MMFLCICFSFFFFNDTATTEIYTLSLHDALPISHGAHGGGAAALRPGGRGRPRHRADEGCEVQDRKSTRLNSSHSQISYAVFCLKKKKNNRQEHQYYCVSTRQQHTIITPSSYSAL